MYLDQLKLRKVSAATETREGFRDARVGQANAIRNVDDARQLLQFAEKSG